jgi:hypothetical protein
VNPVEEYTQNPDLLLELVREVIDRLIADDNKKEMAAMEAQLREIARAVENLEKQNIPVPDALRAEKTRLAAAVGVQSDATLAIIHLIEGLDEIVKDFKPYLLRDTGPKATRRTGKPRSKSPKTDSKVLRELIIEALQHYGGSASKGDVHKFIEEKLKGKFLPRDLEWRESTGNYIWQNNTDWERFSMTQDGVLKKGSPIGTWELSEEYR